MNGVQLISMNEQQRILRRAQIQRDRRTANEPWPWASPDQAKAFAGMGADGIPDMRMRLTANQRRVYEKRAEIIERLRAVNSTNVAALAKEFQIEPQFIRWLDGRSRA